MTIEEMRRLLTASRPEVVPESVVVPEPIYSPLVRPWPHLKAIAPPRGPNAIALTTLDHVKVWIVCAHASATYVGEGTPDARARFMHRVVGEDGEQRALQVPTYAHVDIIDHGPHFTISRVGEGVNTRYEVRTDPYRP